LVDGVVLAVMAAWGFQRPFGEYRAGRSAPLNFDISTSLMFIDNPLNSSELIFPTLEVCHILGFTLTLGTIALLDFRALGLGLKRQALGDLARDFAPWTLAGLVSILLSGPMLFSSDPDMYYLNRAFQFKMVCLVLAIVFNYTVHRKMVQSGKSTAWNKLVACVSLLLWAGVVGGGIFIGFA
jgi:hypothetical protein